MGPFSEMTQAKKTLEEQKRKKYNKKVFFCFKYLSLYLRFEINEDKVLLRIGEKTIVTNRTLIEEEVVKFLWQNDLLTFFLYKLGVYDEIAGSYNLSYSEVFKFY